MSTAIDMDVVSTSTASTTVSTTTVGRQVTVATNDNEQFKWNMDMVKISGLLTNLTEYMEDDTVAIPVPKVSSAAMKKIIDWCHLVLRRAGDDKFPEDLEDPQAMSRRDAQRARNKTDDDAFLDMTVPELIELLEAANYMDIHSLIDVITTHIAKKAAGKTTEQLRVLFDIKNDFTPEEEARVRANTQWCCL